VTTGGGNGSAGLGFRPSRPVGFGGLGALATFGFFVFLPFRPTVGSTSGGSLFVTVEVVRPVPVVGVVAGGVAATCTVVGSAAGAGCGVG
jgi:hypothetical protein